jgi:hypothetical protein
MLLKFEYNLINMNNATKLSSEINHTRKSSIQTLYEIQMNAKKKNFDSYKKVFIIKKESEIERANLDKKKISHSTTNSIPNISLNQSNQQKS